VGVALSPIPIIAVALMLATQAVALAVFVLLAALGPGIPVGIYFLMGDRAAATLESLRGWMVRENVAIMSVSLPGDRREADRRRHQRALRLSDMDLDRPMRAALRPVRGGL
jgi:hypothetical protein